MVGALVALDESCPSLSRGDRFAIRKLQKHKVSNFGFAVDTIPQPFFKVTIRPRQAVMLTKVFCPGTHNERFEIAICDFPISTPRRGV